LTPPFRTGLAGSRPVKRPLNPPYSHFKRDKGRAETLTLPLPFD
jgi:hypothetical protein